MDTLRHMHALDKLVSLLSKNNKYIVTQVCGILNNLCPSSLGKVDSLRILQAPHFLSLLRTNKNKGVVRGAKLVLEQIDLSKNGLSQEIVNGNGDLDKILESLFYLDEDNTSDQEERKTPSRKMNNTEEMKNKNIREDGALVSTKKPTTNKIKSKIRPKIIKKLSFLTENESNIGKTEKLRSPVHYSIKSSPNRTELIDQAKNGSQSSVKTLTYEHDTPKNSPQRDPPPPPAPQSYQGNDVYWATDELYPPYPYAPPYPQYPHYLDMPPPNLYHTRPMTHHIGYLPHHYMSMTPTQKYPYSAHNSPYKRTPCSPRPMRPYHFNEALNQHYAQQQQQQQQHYRMPTNSSLSRHEIAINQARLDKHSKSRSYTDSQGDLVTDL